MKGYKISSIDLARVARDEGIPARQLKKRVKDGTVVIPHNPWHRIKSPCGIGAGLRVKINANIGTSPISYDSKTEIRKLRAAVRYGADAVMDLSTGGPIQAIRRLILKQCPVPVGTVPIYEAAIRALTEKKSIAAMTGDEMLQTLVRQAEEGVDFFTIHAGITRQTVQTLRRGRRTIPVVSRGGAFLVDWIAKNKKENPFYERFDEVLDIASRYQVTLSLGDGLRPGAICDSTDRPQVHELIVLGELARRCRQRGVQVMIEGPGHVPLNHIAANIELQKRLCDGAPFYVLGPLVTDAAAGHDHLVSAIGGAYAAWHGADFLCYVTPAEHLSLPAEDDVREGVIASKIAAHVADVARGRADALRRDLAMSRARVKRDWKTMARLALDPSAFLRRDAGNRKDVCSMCDEFCSMKMVEKV